MFFTTKIGGECSPPSMDPNSKYVTLPYAQDGRQGAFTMSKGTALALGFTADQLTANTRSYTVGAKTYQRAAYIGGPTLTVHRLDQTITRQIGSSSGAAKTEKKFILTLGTTTDTVYYTGPMHSALKWLQTSINVPDVGISNKNGKSLSVSLPPAPVIP